MKNEIENPLGFSNEKLKGKLKMKNQTDFPKENQKYGTWYNRVVYKITRADYIKYKYYEKVDGSFAFWIIDDNNYFITDNVITGKIIETFDRTVVEDAIEEAGRIYY